MDVVALTKPVARGLGPQNILINMFGPGKIESDRVRQLNTRRAINTGSSVVELQQATVKIIALGCYGQPHELACVVVLLCSEAATDIAGQTALADGGLAKAYETRMLFQRLEAWLHNPSEFDNQKIRYIFPITTQAHILKLRNLGIEEFKD